MTDKLILASASPFRRKLLSDAGISFAVVRPEIDERAVEAAIGDADVSPEDVALILAAAKAQEVSLRDRDAIVIGSDQTLSFGDRIFHKPSDMRDARARLLQLSGKTHHLNSAVVIARNGETLWKHCSVAALTMRHLDPGFVGRFLARTGEGALASVGAYQIEGEGIQLFESIEGDYFTIIGLPLLPLLAKLRELEIIDG